MWKTIRPEMLKLVAYLKNSIIHLSLSWFGIEVDDALGGGGLSCLFEAGVDRVNHHYPIKIYWVSVPLAKSNT